MVEITGKIRIYEMGWEWTPDSEARGDVEQLERDLSMVRKINPSFGVSLYRRVKWAERCQDYKDDIGGYVRCLVNNYKV